MSDHEAKSKGILRWLGLGTGPQAGEEIETAVKAAETSAPVEQEDPRERRRRQLLTDIGSFLLTHHLEVNAFTLAIAHDVLTGADPKLACLLEVSAPKPGNVSPDRHFADMRYEDFLASAAAIGEPLAHAGERRLGLAPRGVGTRAAAGGERQEERGDDTAEQASRPAARGAGRGRDRRPSTLPRNVDGIPERGPPPVRRSQAGRVGPQGGPTGAGV